MFYFRSYRVTGSSAFGTTSKVAGKVFSRWVVETLKGDRIEAGRPKGVSILPPSR